MRANAVKTLIVEKGISPERIQTEAYGETRPVASNETAAGRQENRRVELTIVFE
jgi:outer membrane protein OmpA-like peptidoglycan-associated protein